MKITWLDGEPFTCLCSSESQPGISYMLDVLTPACDCEDFRIRHEGVPGACCKHLDLARNELLDKFLDVFRVMPRITGCPSGRSPSSEPSKEPSTGSSAWSS